MSTPLDRAREALKQCERLGFDAVPLDRSDLAAVVEELSSLREHVETDATLAALTALAASDAALLAIAEAAKSYFNSSTVTGGTMHPGWAAQDRLWDALAAPALAQARERAGKP